MAVAIGILWGLEVETLFVRVPAWLGLVVSALWFLVPGHALAYGPHLILLEIWELLTWPFRKDSRK